MTSVNATAVRPPSRSIVKAADVCLSFGQTQALAGASLAVVRGEIVAVMGPSGSGKSTLLHCLAGIFPPDSGEIYYDGERIDLLSDARRTELRRTDFGFVFQFGQLVPELTVADNIALPLLLNRVKRRNAYATVNEWLPRLGLQGLGGRRTGELSGGQAQRVALARALVARPSVLFADEPTGALDTLTGEVVMDLLVTTAREEGTTVILVTHDARVAAYADRDVTVRDGMVAESPAPADAPAAYSAAAHAAQAAQAAQAANNVNAANAHAAQIDASR